MPTPADGGGPKPPPDDQVTFPRRVTRARQVGAVRPTFARQVGAVRPTLAPAAASQLERQRALLYHSLNFSLEQRRHLIDGDMEQLEETNRLLGSLIESQQALHGELRDSDQQAETDPELLEELHSLAQQLQQESRTNYLLACRGAQFANFSISLLTGARDPADDDADAPSPPDQSHLMDQPA